jgi:TctA family transporter
MLGTVIESSIDGFLLVFSWPNILYPVCGTLLAMIFSFLPGIGSITLLALAISFTFDWETIHIMLFFGALVGGATFMGSITAILFNIPGTSPNAATVLDGYPMAKKGQAKTAIGCSATASALGSSFGIVVLILLIPVMRKTILFFGPPEFLMLAIWGLTTIAVLVRGSLVKGLISAGLGLIFSFVGFDPRTAELRYTFGINYLWDGVNLIPVFLGIFAIAEMINLTVSSRQTISGKTRAEELTGSIGEGILSVFRNFGLFIRSSIIGTVIGIIPGIGGSIASFVAYGQALQSAGKDREKFGEGDIRGVLAPEAANDAKDGGSLLPTLAFGIPGNEGTAILLAVLILHGLVPGKELMDNHLNLIFVLIWSLFLSNILTSILGIVSVSPLSRLTIIRTQLLTPIILVLATLGAYVYKGQIEDIIMAYIFGFLGYYMKKYKWPRTPFVIAIVLGAMFESNFHITLSLHELGRINFWSRPITMMLLLLTVVSLFLPYIQSWWAGRGEQPK